MIFKRGLTVVLFLVLFGGSSYAQETTTREVLTAGNSLVASARYEEAINEYSKIGPGAALYPQSLYNIGVCYYELMQTEKAISYYHKALAVSGLNYPRASYALGVALEDLGHTDAAKDAYLQTSKTHNEFFGPALFKLGVIAAARQQFKTASDLFVRAAQIQGEHTAAAHNNLGVMLAQIGRLNEAAKEFSIALGQTQGRFADAQKNLSLCRELLSTANDNKLADFAFVTRSFEEEKFK